MTTSPDLSTAPVVVGVDSSAGSEAALLWALEEARLRSAPLEAVMAWHVVPLPPSPTGRPPTRELLSGDDRQARTQDVLEQTVRAVLGDVPDVRRRAVHGSPAAVLVEASRTAQLVVVGTRGLGGFAGLLLGSVSTQLAQYARCPVTIIPPRAR